MDKLVTQLPRELGTKGTSGPRNPQYGGPQPGTLVGVHNG